MAVLPLAWRVEEAPVLLVGGGEVATTRIEKLLPAGALVVVVSPEATERINQLAEERKLEWIKRKYQDEDIEMKSWNIVLTAIPDRDLSEHIVKQSRHLKIPVNAADIPPLCDFYFGSTIQRDDLNIMISTGGNAPRLARKVRQSLEAVIDDSIGPAVTKMGTFRKMVRDAIPGTDRGSVRLRMTIVSKLSDSKSLKELSELTESQMVDLVNVAQAAAAVQGLEVSDNIAVVGPSADSS